MRVAAARISEGVMFARGVLGIHASVGGSGGFHQEAGEAEMGFALSGRVC